MPGLEIMLIVAGLLHFTLLWPALLVPKVLNWRRELAHVSGTSRQVIWIHGGFIVLVNLSFGAISIAMAPALASGEPLARAMCGMIAIYWTSRLVLQLAVFEARDLLTAWWLKLGYHGLTLMFVYFAIVYWAGALWPLTTL